MRTEGGRRGFCVCAEENRNVGLGYIIGIYIYIYNGCFCNFRVSGFYLGRVSGRVLDFFIKPGPDLDLLQSFFFFKPIPDPIPYQTG